MKSVAKQQSGMVIVLAILIVGSVLSTAIVLGNLIIREIMQSRLIDQSIQAYYHAESGSERALHQVRQRQGVVDCNLLDGGTGATCDDTSHCTNDSTAPCVNIDGGSLGSWDVVTVPEPETVITLSEGASFQVDLFDIAQTSNSEIGQISVDYDDSSIRILGELTNLTNILNISVGNCSDQDPVLKGIIPPLGVRFSSLHLTGSQIFAECSYIFKINYPPNDDGILDSTLITIKVFKANDDQLPIPSRLIIDSEAIFGDSFQSIRVRTPIRPPLSGLYDFVLFSEESIDKTDL